MVQGASFSTSAIRSYTGDTGPTGNALIGATGATGATGAAPSSLFAPTGPTGTTGGLFLSTIFEDGRYKLLYTTSTGGTITVIPQDRFDRYGLTGIDGPVTGTFATFGNFLFAGGATVLANVQNGTLILPGSEQYSTSGVSGSTLEFRKIGVAGDLVFYTDEAQKIGTGATYYILGISGPNALNDFGSIEAQSIGEIAILRGPSAAVDGHGLTFTENTTTIPPGLASGGTTWGTLHTNMLVSSNHYNVVGSVDTGVLTDPFFLNNDKANTHLIYAPFDLRGISFSSHSPKKPVSTVPSWVYESTGETGVTADHGEMHTATLLINIKNSPRDVNFSNRFYFDPDNNTLSAGVNIVNCLSFDEGYSWFCTVTGKYYRLNDTGDDVTLYGACCNSVEGTPKYLDCNDFVTKQECDDKADQGYEFYLDTTCSDSPCNIGFEIGSCCVNKDSQGETNCLDTGNMPGGIVLTRELCEKYGGNFRPLTPCGPDFPCGNPCNEDFGERGACCEFDSLGQYVACYDDFGIEECIAKGESIDGYTSFNGDGTFCATTDCCAGEAQFGACCGVDGNCSRTTAKTCAELEGFYQGNGTVCENVVCTCDPTDPPPGGGGGGPDGPEPPALGACCGLNGNCVEQVYETDCPSGFVHYPGLNCASACPELPPPPPPLGKCCKGVSTCNKCSNYFFECNDTAYDPQSKWLIGTDDDGAKFGGFPFCECNDNGGLGIDEASCYTLFGSDAIWTQRNNPSNYGPLEPNERCKVTDVGTAFPFVHCGDFESNIGKCCTGKTDDVLGCECHSCYSQSECANELLAEGICPPDGSECDILGWVEYFKQNPGDYYTPSTPYGNTQKSCGGCDDPPGAQGQSTNCVACGSSVPGGGGDGTGGDCGCSQPGPKVGCVCYDRTLIEFCDDQSERYLYTFETTCCQDPSSGTCNGDNCVAIDGCVGNGNQCGQQADVVIQGFINTFDLSGPPYITACPEDIIGGGDFDD